MSATKRKRFQKLNWWSPIPIKRRLPLPHGMSGIASVSSGIYLILHSISGNLDPYLYQGSIPFPFAVVLFSTSTFINAWAGYQLSHIATIETRPIFKRCAILQMCLSYYVLRFMPHASIFLQFLTISFTSTITMAIKALDVILCLIMMACTLSFHMVAWDFWIKKSLPAISTAVAIGTMGILLLSTYPLHLAMSFLPTIWGHGTEADESYGNDFDGWWTCIQDKYPMQNAGMVAYIYIPATVTFSLMLFGATLYLRGILSHIEYGMGSVIIIVVCLLGTVLSQELHIPDVSTQRIYLPCHEPEYGSLEADLVKSMDFSRYARRILTSLLGVEFENDLYHDGE